MTKHLKLNFLGRESSCRLCSPIRHGVSIPNVMQIYHWRAGKGSGQRTGEWKMKDYDLLPKSSGVVTALKVMNKSIELQTFFFHFVFFAPFAFKRTKNTMISRTPGLPEGFQLHRVPSLPKRSLPEKWLKMMGAKVHQMHLKEVMFLLWLFQRNFQD